MIKMLKAIIDAIYNSIVFGWPALFCLYMGYVGVHWIYILFAFVFFYFILFRYLYLMAQPVSKNKSA
jgi:hypothetical protein